MSGMLWIQRALPCRGSHRGVFLPLLSALGPTFDKMEEDKFSRCVPLKPIPKGVQASGPPHSFYALFRVGAWNKARDEELSKLEPLACSGLRMSKAQLIALALFEQCPLCSGGSSR